MESIKTIFPPERISCKINYKAIAFFSWKCHIYGDTSRFMDCRVHHMLNSYRQSGAIWFLTHKDCSNCHSSFKTKRKNGPVHLNLSLFSKRYKMASLMICIENLCCNPSNTVFFSSKEYLCLPAAWTGSFSFLWSILCCLSDSNRERRQLFHKDMFVCCGLCSNARLN